MTLNNEASDNGSIVLRNMGETVPLILTILVYLHNQMRGLPL